MASADCHRQCHNGLVTAIVSIWGTAVIIAHTEKHPEVVASTSIDVMKMMRDAKGLPEERFRRTLAER